MESSPGPWISALRHSHDRLRAAVEPLGLDQLEQRSYASEWSIAQVLSHLGSQAEIFGLFLDAGLTVRTRWAARRSSRSGTAGTARPRGRRLQMRSAPT